MATRINDRGITEYVDDNFARGMALELLERCRVAADRADETGGYISDDAARRVQADYHEAARLLGQIGELGADGLSDTEAERRQAQLRKVAAVYEELVPAMDSESPVQAPETESVTVRAIPGAPGYFIVLGRGGPAQFASHALAEAEARRRAGFTQ